MNRRTRSMPIAPRVMIECLVAEGVIWAGWYSTGNLNRKFDEVTGGFMRGGHGQPFSAIMRPGYLPGDRRKGARHAR